MAPTTQKPYFSKPYQEKGMKQTEATAESLGVVVVKTETVNRTIQQIARASEEQSPGIFDEYGKILILRNSVTRDCSKDI